MLSSFPPAPSLPSSKLLTPQELHKQHCRSACVHVRACVCMFPHCLSTSSTVPFSDLAIVWAVCVCVCVCVCVYQLSLCTCSWLMYVCVYTVCAVVIHLQFPDTVLCPNCFNSMFVSPLLRMSLSRTQSKPVLMSDVSVVLETHFGCAVAMPLTDCGLLVFTS